MRSARRPNLPLHKLLGGAVRDKVEYFGFVQGDTPDELAAHARELAKAGFKVLYVKVGRGDELDVAIVSDSPQGRRQQGRGCGSMPTKSGTC